MSVVVSISVSSSIEGVTGVCGGVAGVSACEDEVVVVFLRVDVDDDVFVVVVAVSSDVLAVEACFGDDAVFVVA